jgi:hypothetical protein
MFSPAESNQEDGGEPHGSPMKRGYQLPLDHENSDCENNNGASPGKDGDAPFKLNRVEDEEAIPSKENFDVNEETLPDASSNAAGLDHGFNALSFDNA